MESTVVIGAAVFHFLDARVARSVTIYGAIARLNKLVCLRLSLLASRLTIGLAISVACSGLDLLVLELVRFDGAQLQVCMEVLPYCLRHRV